MLTFRCKTCDTEFEDNAHLENHRKVHGRKSKIYEYGDPETNKFRIQE